MSVACNGAHSLKQRLARWLLMMRDRGDEDALPITQNLLAEMLGVQRPSITNAARELERAQARSSAAGGRSLYLIGKGLFEEFANVISWSERASPFTFPNIRIIKSLLSPIEL